MKQLLIINDLCGYGKVATTAMLPILSYMGVPTYNLPTALVSNNLEYGKFALLETTDYIKQTFSVWKELRFSYDAIATGFMASEYQAKIIADYCREQSQTGTQIFVDPIMGDDGKLYNGITKQTVLAMRRMISVAHLCFPNYTEACLLSDTTYNPQGITEEAAYDLVDKIRYIGSRSVLITSMKVEGMMYVAGYNADKSEYFLLNYDEIPIRIPGTGDIFSAIVIGNLMKGKSLRHATRLAMDLVRTFIDLNKNMPDKYSGIPLEKYLEIID